MNEFYREVAERKRAIRGCGKVGQSKRRAIMPSDYLTPKQRKELDGEVETYDFSKNLNYERFKTYPHSVQQEWIDDFQRKWGLGFAYMARALGTNTAAFWYHCDANNLKVNAKRGKAKRADVMRFEEWLRGDTMDGKAAEIAKVRSEEVTETEIDDMPMVFGGSLEIQGMAGICLEAIYKAIGDHSVKLKVEWSTAE